MSIGADAFLPKPVDYDILLSRVAACVAWRSSLLNINWSKRGMAAALLDMGKESSRGWQH